MARTDFVSNLDEFLKGFKEKPKEIEQIFSMTIRDICHVLHHSITELTPVNTGQTLANYQWSIGTPFSGLVEAMGSGDPGPTNQMPLGIEPRRPENQAVADASLNALNFSKPYQDFILVNNNPAWGGLEDGEYPEFPFRQRSPNGMLTLSWTYVSELVSSGVL